MKYIEFFLVGALIILLLFTLEKWYSNGEQQQSVPDSVTSATDDDSPVPVKNASSPDSGRGENDVIDLSGKKLSTVPAHVFTRTDTIELDVSDNDLSGSLPAEIRQLTKLQRLNLSQNNFTGVPAEVGQLSELRYLDLSNNSLTGLPYELGNLSKLETLDLRGNSYSTLDLDTIKQKLPSATTILID